MAGDIHRIGGANVENLRLKARELQLDPPGISVIQTDTPEEAAFQMRQTFPTIDAIQEASHRIGSASIAAIRAVGFDVIAVPSRNLPNHYRIIHPDGAAGFTDENLARLAETFTETEVE